ncbi:MAG: Gfo/Idh/MocA family oxidoreductase [Saprospiraceae bacterium]|nr:Gfo/Idh/MocA family oxidoreductase [Saprospiraceae bacterium]
MGMVGGGIGAFIGGVHRMAALLDGQIELVCGAFSSDAERSKLSGDGLYIAPERVYGSYIEMIEKEKTLPLGERMDFVSIVTPNHVHFGPAKMALEYGFHVVSDKPLCFNLHEAYELKSIVDKSGLVFALTHNYTGYPMVKQARHLVSSGELGAIRKVIVEYPQGWLNIPKETGDNKQAAWRTDPSKSGIAGAMGDIGTHAENLAEYITGLKISKLCAQISTLVDGRLLDDDGNVLLEFDNGAKGILHASQICAGEENDLNIRVYGEKGGLEWHQMEPNTLVVKWEGAPSQVYRTNKGPLCDAARAHARIPEGHPEGYIEAFANIYRNAAMAIAAHIEGIPHNEMYDFPSIDDGVRGMEFIYKVIESGESDLKWTTV